jgi:hypothetical protein
VVAIAEFWIPILAGGILFAGAIGAWFGDYKRLGVWLGFVGVTSLVFLVALQLDHWIARSGSVRVDPDRPYISVIAIGFPGILIKPGAVIVLWPIRNGGRTPAVITDANVTIWFENDDTPLPAAPRYLPNPNNMKGVVIGIGDVFNANFKPDVVLSPESVQAINTGHTRLFVYGYIKYGDEHERAFIALYDPHNIPEMGMFSNVEGRHPKYSRND